MATTSAIGATTTTAAAGAASTKPTSQTLGKDDFLKLLTTQLQHQDPLNPMDDKEFIGQMAQFSTLEQITNMSSGMTKLALASQVSGATGLLGRQVSYELDDHTTGEGTVGSVSLLDGAVHLDVDGVDVTPDQIQKITAK